MVTFSLNDEYRKTKALLKNNGITDYQFEAKEIICYFFGCTIKDILSDKSASIADDKYNNFLSAIHKRVEKYPLQYIIGEWEFYGYPFKVGDGVLIPRQDTETIIEAVKSMYFTDISILDLCSGSGCIAITLKKELPQTSVYALEIDDKAYSFLTKNAELNNADITAIKGNVLYSETTKEFPMVDVIVSNPPYLTKEDMENLQKEVAFEPSLALAGGDDGLLFYSTITSVWKNKLKENGYIFYEIGLGQQEDVKDILLENGFNDINYYKDLNGIIRVVSAKKIKVEG